MDREKLTAKLWVYRLIILPVTIVLMTYSSAVHSLTPINATETSQSGSMEEYPRQRLMNGTTELKNITITICEDRQCENAFPSFCQCDEDCIGYKDCCRNVSGDSLSNFLRDDGARRGGLKCVGTSQENISNPITGEVLTFYTGYYMVGECLKGAQNASLVERCHDSTDLLPNHLPSWNQYADHVPVLDLSTQRTYKNVHCALCNAVRYRNMRFWQLVVTQNCDVNGSSDACDLVEFQSVYPSDVENLRRCTVIEEASCPVTALNKATRTLCESYQAPYPLNGTIYKNPHCAFCNNEEFFKKNVLNCVSDVDRGDTKTTERKLPQVIPFYFSFREDDNDNVVFCAEGLSYNQSSETCELSQNSTEITLEQCIDSKTDKINITLTLSANMAVAQSMGEQSPSLPGVSSFSLVGVTQCNSMSNIDDFTTVKPLDCVWTEVIQIASFEELSESSFLDRFRNQGVQIIGIEMTMVCTEFAAESLSSYSFLGTFSSSNLTLYTFQFTHYAKVRSKNRVYSDVKAVTTLRQLAAIQGDEVPYNGTTYNISLHDISREDLLCPYTILPENEYHLADRNKSLRSKFFDDKIPMEDYIILSNGDLRICSHWIRKETPPYTEFLLFVYIVLTTMSLIGLLLTFINYCILKELRNVPGLITMNFVMALFFAQLVLIPSYISPENSLLCTLISMAGHFLWLATFLWMTIIAYDVTRTFGTSSTTGHIKSRRQRLATYMLIGWLIPALFVALCFLIRTYTNLKDSFTYGELRECWLTPGMANFYLFGVPASLCLCCNFIMFFITIHGIWKAKKHAKMAKNMTTANVVKEQLLLSVKISILIGLSWIWAFLHSYFKQVVAFLFIHTFLNSLQGTFVFLVYVCNRRVLAMWRGKYERFYVQKHSSDASKDTTKRSNDTASTSLSHRGNNPRKGDESIILEGKITKS